MNFTALSFTYGFFSKPQGGYPETNPGAINRQCPTVVIRPKGNKKHRAVTQKHQGYSQNKAAF